MPSTTTSIMITDVKYTQNHVINNPNSLFVFGDNLLRRGTGGQAIIRNMPNTFGIATKRSPSMKESAFFADNNMDDEQAVMTDLQNLHFIVQQRVFQNIVFPMGGLGTGLSKMPEKCPQLFKKMMERLYSDYHILYYNGKLAFEGF